MVGDVIAAASRDESERLRALAPAGVEVRPVQDGLDGVAFLVPDSGLDVDLSGLPDLRVVQVLSAGTEWIEDRIPAGVTLCNARGARDAPVAEWVVGAVLGAATGLLAASRRRSWRHEPPHDVAGSTAVIVGYGSIGRATGRLLEALGVTVQGVGRRAREGVHGMDELPGLLPRADTVILLTPLTDATRGLVDAAFLGRMRDGALFVNAGRGASVDTEALLAELQSGRLRAVLDVVDPEPLPEEHPLWAAPGLLALTSHQAGDSARADERALALAAEQMGRVLRGEPLENVIRPA
jgi:phosphoglycerate dehydrogenase-like enzyme